MINRDELDVFLYNVESVHKQAICSALQNRSKILWKERSTSTSWNERNERGKTARSVKKKKKSAAKKKNSKLVAAAKVLPKIT